MPRSRYLPPENVLWMGRTVGEWAVYAFTTESEAQRWAASSPDAKKERVYWSVPVPDSTIVYMAEVIPASTVAKQVSP